MGQLVVIDGLAIQLYAFHVNAIGGFVGSRNHKVLSVLQMQGGLGEQRRTDDILGRTGMEGIESQSGEDIPG